VQQLNSVTVKGGIKKVALFIQDSKVRISKDTLTKLNGGTLPAEQYSWVDSKTRNNLYKEPQRFYTTMLATAGAWDEDFFYEPIQNFAVQIREASIEAFKIVYDKTREYIAAPNVSGKPDPPTGYLQSSYRIRIDGTDIASTNDLKTMGPKSTVSIINLAEYSSKAEVNALYYANTGGIMYYAAEMITRKYPDLGIRMGWVNADTVGGLPHKKNLPVIFIGPKALVKAGIQKPGVNLRKDPRRKYRAR